DTQAWSLVEAKPFINQCADLAEKQTFPLQFRQTFGTPLHESLVYPIHCWYQTSFFIEEPPSICKLMMDEDAISGRYTLYLNGNQIDARGFVPDGRYGYRQLACEVQPFLKKGMNRLVAEVEILRDEDGIRDPLYLTGSFGVTLDAAGKPALGLLPATGSVQSGVVQGYPYYAGTLCFTREISIEALPRDKTFAL